MRSNKLLQSIGLPYSDVLSVHTGSNKSFADGSNFGIEIPTVNSIDTLDALLTYASNKKITINRITETKGIFLHTKEEIKQFVDLTCSYGCDLLMSIGPRATYDTSATVRTNDGFRIGYRLRGQDQLSRAIEDLLYAYDIGVRNFLIYDEGLLNVLCQLRRLGKLDSAIKFKISAHCGHGNAASIKLLENIGADSVNQVRDLTLAMMSSIRSAVNIPLDIHTDNPKSSGGFIRFYEAPDIVQIASPVYLKVGNSVLESHGSATNLHDAKNIIRNIDIVLDMMSRYANSAIQLNNSRLKGNYV